MAQIGVFLATGFEECEALLVVDICRRSGIDLKTGRADEVINGS